MQVHARAKGEVPIIKQVEAEIVQQLLNVMQKKSPKEKDRLLELARLKNSGLIDAVVSESIGLFFLCKNMDDIIRLLELLESKELQRIVEIIYNNFMPSSTKLEVILTWSADEFNEVKRNFEGRTITNSS